MVYEKTLTNTKLFITTESPAVHEFPYPSPKSDIIISDDKILFETSKVVAAGHGSARNTAPADELRWPVDRPTCTAC